ncbi:MAG: ImmA/IrrE family metallo-endopeptidase [Magnetococcus sp. DMHC-8]
MKMVPDNTGRFGLRPHYTQMELDQEFEALICAFLYRRHGEAQFPISTNDLVLLIEEDSDDLDTYADLSRYGRDVCGLTVFPPDGGPHVLISRDVSDDPRMENRFRTTLAHEFGHVYLHRQLWDRKYFLDRLSHTDEPQYAAICKRSTILGEGTCDWMEWQAGYACGAILMPVSQIHSIVGNFREAHDVPSSISLHVESEQAREIIRVVMERFLVSEEAARVRLLKLKCLLEFEMEISYFE